jgi:hypothetical protein
MTRDIVDRLYDCDETAFHAAAREIKRLRAESRRLLGTIWTYPNLIREAMETYRCQCSTDKEGNGLPLADVLTPGSHSNVAEGYKEMALLSDHIIGHMLDKEAAELAKDGE